VRGELFEIA